MNAETEQSNDGSDASSDDDVEAQLHETVSPSVSRRDFLRAGATASAIVASGGAASAATSDSDDPYDPPNSLADDTVTLDYQMQTAASREEAGIMTLVTPVSQRIHESFDKTAAVASNLGHWAWGSWVDNPEERQNEQLALDVNAHCRTIRDNMQALIKSNYNNFQMLNNNALIAGEVAAVKAIKAGKSESQVAAEAQRRVEDMISVYEENLYRVWESAIVRTVNLRNQQVIAYGDSSYDPTVVYERDVNADWFDQPIGTRSIDVELENGDTITTECLVLANGNPDKSGVIYAHPVFNFSGKVPNYSSLSDDASIMMDQLCETHDTYDKWENHGFLCKAYDSNNDRVQLFSDDGFVGNFVSASSSTWPGYVQQHIIDRANTLTSDMQQYVSDLFSALNSGEIENVKEVMSPYAYSEMMAGDWLETGSTGFPIGAARMGGYSTDMKRQGTYVHVDPDGEDTTYDGANLLWDSRNPPNLGSLSSETLGGSSWTINVPIGTGSTLHLESYPDGGKSFSASHSSESVSSIGVQFGTGDSATPVASKSAPSVSPTRRELEDALSRHDVSHGDTVTITVETQTEAGSSTTVSATEVTVLVETRLLVGSEYTVPSTASVYVADKNGMHTIPSGDSVRLKSVKDADGNALDYITITDSTLMTLDDTSDVQEQWNAILDSQQTIEEETPDGDGSLGGSGGGSALPDLGGDIGWMHVLGGLGGLGILSALLSLAEGGNGGKRR